MTEPTGKLERELAAMRPRRPSGELVSGIEAGLARDKPRNGLLVGAMSMGAIAACVIAAMLWAEPRAALSVPAPTNVATSIPKFGDPPQAFAWTDRSFQINGQLENP